MPPAAPLDRRPGVRLLQRPMICSSLYRFFTPNFLRDGIGLCMPVLLNFGVTSGDTTDQQTSSRKA